MATTPQLWLFFVMVLGVVVLPGLDMAFVLARALVDGRRAGLFAVAGLLAGGVVHVTAGALGLGALLELVPAVFNAMLLAGALYIAWIAVGLLRGPAIANPPSGVGAPGVPAALPMTAGATFRQAAITNLLNPKAYLFMFAVFPQFVAVGPGAPPVWRQALVLARSSRPPRRGSTDPWRLPQARCGIGSVRNPPPVRCWHGWWGWSCSPRRSTPVSRAGAGCEGGGPASSARKSFCGA